MNLSHRLRWITVVFSLCALLLAQTALAGYVCPGSASVAATTEMTEMGRTAGAAMPCAESTAIAIDDEQPGLCHAHCQGQQQSADSYQVPVLATLAELGEVLTVAALATRGEQPKIWQTPLLHRAGVVPLAIRYCCFRN